MIKAIEVVIENELQHFEIADHFPIVEIGRLENALDLAGVAVRKLAFVGMLAQHVTVFDFKESADSIGHGKV